MAYLSNRAVNLLNLHYGLHAMALSGGGAFFIVYLLQAGVPAPGVLAAMALVLAGRFALRPMIVGVAARWGLRRLLVAGTLLGALQYPLLAEVDGPGPALYALVALSSVAEMVYWTCYHAYFAALGDNEHRGHQLGVREAVAALVGITSPLLAGWLLVAFGPRVAFGLTAIVAAMSALPLLWTPDAAVARTAPGSLAAAREGILLFVADGWLAAGNVFVWQLALFVALGRSYVAYGGALALAALAGAAGSLLLGRSIDSGHGRRAVGLALGTFGLVVVLRAAALGNPAMAVAASALGSISYCLYNPTLMTAVYTLAKRSPCPLRFHVAAEGGWDAGGAAGLLACAAMLWLGVPLWAGILTALAGLAAQFHLLRRYYCSTSRPAGREPALSS